MLGDSRETKEATAEELEQRILETVPGRVSESNSKEGHTDAGGQWIVDDTYEAVALAPMGTKGFKRKVQLDSSKVKFADGTGSDDDDDEPSTPRQARKSFFSLSLKRKTETDVDAQQSIKSKSSARKATQFAFDTTASKKATRKATKFAFGVPTEEETEEEPRCQSAPVTSHDQADDTPPPSPPLPSPLKINGDEAGSLELPLPPAPKARRPAPPPPAHPAPPIPSQSKQQPSSPAPSTTASGE